MDSIELKDLEIIKNWLINSKSIVITAGAGIGIDSGLSDYRGTGGQWGEMELKNDKSIFEIVNPEAFLENPKLGWETYVSRLVEYDSTTPHKGFYILQEWIHSFALDYFVITSNVDNQFQKAGFNENKIREVHGSLFYMQCSVPCNSNIWEVSDDLGKFKTDIYNGNLPICPNCGNVARPNVYMFRDKTYLPNRTKNQEGMFEEFLDKNKDSSIVVFEIGSGPHVQSIRKKTRMLGLKYGAKIIRINPNDAKIKEPNIGIASSAMKALVEIDKYVKK